MRSRDADLSGLYIGPSDLAQSLGYPNTSSIPTGADTMAAIQRILQAAEPPDQSRDALHDAGLR